MSIQDPPSNTLSEGPLQRDDGTIPTADAARLREAGNTVRNDLGAALEVAKSDFQTLAETAKRDLSAVKDEALGHFQNITGKAGDHAQSLKDQASGEYENLKSQATGQYQALKGQATDQLQTLKGQAQDQLGDAAGKAKAYASEQVAQLTDQARSFATEQKDLAARQIGGVVDAVSRVADELQSSQSGTAVAGYAQDFAGSLRGLADTIQNKSVDDLVGLVQDFGRRQPLAFLGLAALTGFAASRFLLASRRRAAAPGDGTASSRPGDRAFDDGVLAGQGYGRTDLTAVELDRTSAGETDLTTRGVGDNGRI